MVPRLGQPIPSLVRQGEMVKNYNLPTIKKSAKRRYGLIGESPSLAIANRAQTLKESRKENIGTAIVLVFLTLTLPNPFLPEEVGCPQNPSGCTAGNVELLKELYDGEVIIFFLIN